MKKTTLRIKGIAQNQKDSHYTTPGSGRARPNSHYCTPGGGGFPPSIGFGGTSFSTPGEGGKKEFTFRDNTKKLWNTQGFVENIQDNLDNFLPGHKEMAGME